MTSWAVPGARCVCIDVRGLLRFFYPGTLLPRERQIYTVREVLEINGFPLLRLAEIKNYEFDFESGVFEPDFHRARFRPLVERPTSIKVFERLLTPAKVGEDA